MAAEDRDLTFEKALAQHLRANNPNGVADANASHAPDACPDAEMLAAYHERSLSAEQTAIAKQHILACRQCQAVLEHLAATDEIPLSVPTPVAQPQTAAGGGVHILTPRRTQVWRWVAPAGAIAAAFLVWVAVRENTSVRKLSVNEITQTAAPAPAAPSIQAVPEAIARAKPPNAAPLATQLVPASPRSDADRSRLGDNRRAYSAEASTFLPKDEAAPAPKPSGGFAGAGQETPQQDLKSEEAELSRDMAAAEKKQKLDAATDTLNQVTRAEPSREQSAAIGGALRQSVTVETAGPAKQRAKKAGPAGLPDAATAAASPTAPAEQQQMQGMSRFREAPAVLLANSGAFITVGAPGGSATWRIGPAGSIAHSADGGKTWTPQASGVSAGLVAGAAVSDQVCWLVGNAGTVLLTTDAGAHWQKLTAPNRDDLLSISATDARQATVTTAVGSYQTTDGGSTWHKLAGQ